MRSIVTPGIVALGLIFSGCAPSGPHADLKEGWELMVAKDYDAARDHYEAMLAEYPGNPYAHLNLGVAYHQLGNPDLAREHYEVAIAEGGNAEISMISEEGNVGSRPTTVAEIARTNLDALAR